MNIRKRIVKTRVRLIMLPIVLIWLALLLSGRGIVSETQAIDLNDWELTFSDEFNGSTLDTAKWQDQYEWGRTHTDSHIAYMTPDALEFSGGILRIRSEKRNMGGMSYTSGVVASYGKFSQQYGYFEIRGKMPDHGGAAPGLWPAFWLLPPTGEWPPEVDIFEWLSSGPTTQHMNIWWDKWPNQQSQPSSWTGPDFSDDFHMYGFEWSANECIWYIDGIERKRYTNSVNIPHEPMYILAETLIGGWAGTPNSSTPFPSYFDIDYIRVYQRRTGPPPSPSPYPSPTASPTPSCARLGDVDCDQVVNSQDALKVFQNWLLSSPTTSRADVNRDGRVNGVDFGYVVRDWNL